MISARTAAPLPELELQLQLQSVQVKRMELFIVDLNENNLKENKAIRYQVILFLTTSAGEVWSDMVLENWQKPADWINWSCRFRAFLDYRFSHNPGCLQQQFPEENLQSLLVSSTLEQLQNNPGRNQGEIKTVLFEHASTYISLF